MANKLFVGNIEWGVTEEELQALFAKYGETEEVVIVKDKFSGRPKGFGFVTYKSEDDAAKAIAELNDYELNGRKLAVNEARPPQERD